MTTVRLDIRLSREIKAKAEKASALLGCTSLTEYVVNLIDENATLVIKQHESITVEDDNFDHFVSTCKTVIAPNKALRDAAIFAEELGINDV